MNNGLSDNTSSLAYPTCLNYGKCVIYLYLLELLTTHPQQGFQHPFKTTSPQARRKCDMKTELKGECIFVSLFESKENAFTVIWRWMNACCNVTKKEASVLSPHPARLVGYSDIKGTRKSATSMRGMYTDE